jgi:deazaflavin-dependent oxidoreductase (nitroreductase family)
MSFDAKKGSRGGWLPSGPVFRWLNNVASSRMRRKGRTTEGFSVAVLHTVGRKSGEVRTNPVRSFAGPDGSWLVVASAGGAAKNPAWYYNVAGHPDQVQIEVGGQKIAVVAEQLHGAERAEAWRQITTTAPPFAKYEKKTDREIPVIRLVRRDAMSG